MYYHNEFFDDIGSYEANEIFNTIIIIVITIAPSNIKANWRT